MVLRNVLIALGAVALLAGLALAAVWMTHAPSAQSASGKAPALPSILVAARPIAIGTLLRPGDTAWREVAGGVVPGTILRDAGNENAFMGGVTRRAYNTGEPLADSAIVKYGDRSFLATVLAPGNRAVTIAVDAPKSVGGLVLPGDRVDLILTQSFGDNSAEPGRRSVGETVLRNIRVIAVDQWLDTIAKPVTKGQRVGTLDSTIPSTVTLEVSDGDAERALLAVQLGNVHLAVRALAGSGDALLAARQMLPPTWAGDVSPALRMLDHGMPALAPAQPGAPPRAVLERRSSIEVMHGSKTEIR